METVINGDSSYPFYTEEDFYLCEKMALRF